MERLKTLRQKRNLLQKDVATAINIGRTTYVKYENGDSEPSLSMLIELANFFNVTTDYLLGITNTTNTDNSLTNNSEEQKLELTEQEKALLEAFRSTTELGRQRIIQNMLNICDEIEKKNTRADTKNSG